MFETRQELANKLSIALERIEALRVAYKTCISIQEGLTLSSIETKLHDLVLILLDK